MNLHLAAGMTSVNNGYNEGEQRIQHKGKRYNYQAKTLMEINVRSLNITQEGML